VLDCSRPLEQDDRDLLAKTRQGPRVIVASKCDLAAAWSAAEVHAHVLRVSATNGHGIDELRHAIVEALSGRDPSRDTPAVTNVRHVELLTRAAEALRRAARAAREGTPEECVAADLGEARALLEEVTGARTPEDVLQTIFSKFCIGK
jgi:tRNA modification GTPase